jgi:hypothetical protein
MAEEVKTTEKKPDNPAKRPEDRQTGKSEVYAYTLTDKNFGEFKVFNTANGWWLDKQKVHDLIAAYKIDATDEEACAYAGINAENLKYFQTMHPNFLTIKHTCKQMPCLKARKTVNDALSETDHARWYLERKRKKEFSSRTELSGPDGESLPPIQIEIVRPKNANTNTTEKHPVDNSIRKEPTKPEENKS